MTAQAGDLQVQFSAEQGPLGTSRYRIALEVVALDARRILLHMSHADDNAPAVRMAMQTYLATPAGTAELIPDSTGFSWHWPELTQSIDKTST